MEKKETMKMTDEILNKYLNGTASEEEKNAVKEYMAESDEHLYELMSIVDAIREHQEIDNQKVKPIIKTKAVYYRVAAAVAVLLVCGGIWLTQRNVSLSVGGQNTHNGEQFAQLEIPEKVPSNAIAEPTVSEPAPETLTKNDGKKSHPNTQLENHCDTNPISTTIDNNSPHEVIRMYNPREGESRLMAASTIIESRTAEEVSDTVFLKAIIPYTWNDSENLEISWTSNSPDSIVVELRSIKGEVLFNKKFAPKNSSTTISSSMRDKFLHEGKRMECRIMVVSKDGIIQKRTSNIITLPSSKQ